ncbi:hypothetical protein [Streptomyces sp. NPDC058280]|uniref:hypothetical protein n=1 Tax=Streptomyces sp. NPDC058280 TaxID=3346419 RepID=UPI0036ED4B45
MRTAQLNRGQGGAACHLRCVTPGLPAPLLFRGGTGRDGDTTGPERARLLAMTGARTPPL